MRPKLIKLRCPRCLKRYDFIPNRFDAPTCKNGVYVYKRCKCGIPLVKQWNNKKYG